MLSENVTGKARNQHQTLHVAEAVNCGEKVKIRSVYTTQVKHRHYKNRGSKELQIAFFYGKATPVDICFVLRTAPTFVSAHTFCASRKAWFKRHARAGLTLTQSTTLPSARLK